MQTRIHMVALGLLGAFGILVVTSAKTPVQRMNASAPPVERQHMALVAAYVVSASDVCVRANAPDPNAVDPATLGALKDACTKAAEEQARALNWNEGEWVPEDPNADSAAPAKRPSMGPPRVARRLSPGAVEEPAGRNRK